MIYLASTSPRRQKLLREAGIVYKIVKPQYHEKMIQGLSVAGLVRAHAFGKGLSAVRKIKNGLIISADTVVYFGKSIIGKPKNMKDAVSILRKLQGREHAVFTGVALIQVAGGLVQRKKYFMEKSRIKIKQMSEADIRRYFRKINPLDKAGAYAIQSKASSIVEKVSGSYSNAVGLPMEKLKKHLKSMVPGTVPGTI